MKEVELYYFRTELLIEIQKYFDIREFVSPLVYKVFGNRAWKFFDDDLLVCVLIIRKNLGKKITINNWLWGGKFTQRGLRSNIGSIVLGMVKKMKLYLSAHIFGKAVDFDVEGMTATEVRQWIADNQDLFPCKIRLEQTLNGKEINWTHLDTLWEEKNPKVYLFAA